jgi:hypothetical protein
LVLRGKFVSSEKIDFGKFREKGGGVQSLFQRLLDTFQGNQELFFLFGHVTFRDKSKRGQQKEEGGKGRGEKERGEGKERGG